jgi:hypothetical protein
VRKHCQQVVSLDLATPDARHRRPLKFFLYHRSVKSQSTWFFIIVLRKPRGQVPGKSSQSDAFSTLWLALPFAGMVAFRRFRPRAANLRFKLRNSVSFSSAWMINGQRHCALPSQPKLFAFHDHSCNTAPIPSGCCTKSGLPSPFTSVTEAHGAPSVSGCG